MNFWVRFLLKPPKLQFWTVFGIFWALLNRRNFLQDRDSSLFLLYGYLTSRKKSEKKIDEPILISWFAAGQTDGQRTLPLSRVSEKCYFEEDEWVPEFNSYKVNEISCDNHSTLRNFGPCISIKTGY